MAQTPQEAFIEARKKQLGFGVEFTPADLKHQSEIGQERVLKTLEEEIATHAETNQKLMEAREEKQRYEAELAKLKEEFEQRNSQLKYANSYIEALEKRPVQNVNLNPEPQPKEDPRSIRQRKIDGAIEKALSGLRNKK